MGLIVKLSFYDEIRTVEVDADKNARFIEPEIDIAYEQMLVAMNGEPKDELVFAEDYAKRGLDAILDSRIDLLKRYYHDAWVTAFVDAIIEQGADAFGEALGNDDIAELLYKHAFDDDDFDYVEQIARLVDKDVVVGWLVKSLEKSINDGRRRYSSESGNIAKALFNHIDPATDVEVNFERDSDQYDESYQNTVVGTYEVTVKGVQVAKWSKAIAYEIYDEVSFNGQVDDDEFYLENSSKEIEENTISALQELGVDLPAFEDPEPPDHPEQDDDGAFAVLYEYDEDFGVSDRAGTWVIAPYKEKYQASDAIDIAESVLRRSGDEEHVTMTIMRRLTDDEKLARKQIDAFEPEPDEEEYKDEWTPYEG